MTNKNKDNLISQVEESILETQFQGPVAVIAMKGDSLLTHSKDLEFLFENLLNQSILYYVLNLSETRLINSHQIGIIVKHIQEVVKRNGGFAFANPSDRVRYFLEITCITDLVSVYGNVEEAVASLLSSSSDA